MAEQTELIELDFDKWSQIKTAGFTLIQVTEGVARFWVSDSEPATNFNKGFIRRVEDDFNGNYETKVWAKSMGGPTELTVLRKVQ